LLLVTVFPGVVFSQIRDYPNREIEIAVASPPGGGHDNGIRILGGELSKILGVPIVVLNKPTGGGAGAAEYLLKAKPDGYTLLDLGHSDLIAQPIMTPEVSYKFTDFVPIIQFGHQPYTFMVRGDSPFNAVTDLIGFAKKNPGKLTGGVITMGTTTHALFESWRDAAGVDIGCIPYKGGVELTTAVLGGHIDLGVSAIAPAVGLLKAGKMKILVTTAKLKQYPQVPTFAELGFPEIKLQFYLTILAHRDTPKEIVDKLEKAMDKALQTPSVIEKLDKFDLDAVVVKGNALVDSLEKEREAFIKVKEKMKKAIQGK
jgi:tripartite-type tricarboxylate transporter receptor subunit TctC